MTCRRPIASLLENKDSGREEYFHNSPCKGSKEHSYTPAPIDKLGVPGRWLRHKLLDGILVGAPVLQSIQRYRTPMRTTMMKMISFLGTEDFYTVLFLFICWSLDGRLGRLFGILMGIGFYAAGFLKTILRLPRPEWPHIKPEENAYDWALPSHHSLLGTVLPWYIWLYVNIHNDLSSVQLACLFVIIALWSFSVMFSRLYLGVHSPADIVSGGFVGVIVLSLWLQVDDMVDSIISQQKLENVLQCTIIFATLLYLHPKCDPGNPSFTDNCCLAGVLTGLITARSQRTRLLGFPSLMETLPIDTTFVQFVYLSTARLLTGVMVIFTAREALKFVVTRMTCLVYKLVGVPCYSSTEYRKANLTLFKHYTKDFCLPPIHAKASDSEEDDDVASVDSSSSVSSSDCKQSSLWNNTAVVKLLPNIDPSAVDYSSDSWDVVVPSKCIVYFVLTYMALEIVPQLFISVGI